MARGGKGIVKGTGGDDVLEDGGSAQVLDGHRGDDVYIIGNAESQILEDEDGGTDEVRTSLDWQLGDNLENLTLSGGADTSGQGNALDNRILGNVGTNAIFGFAGQDTLDGGEGDDTLDGGSGDDTLIGGAGEDMAMFSGQFAEYDLQREGDGIWVTGPDGRDWLTGIEWVVFADVTLAVADIDAESSAPPPEPLEAVADSGSGLEDNALTLAVLANDRGEGLSVAATTNGAKGLVKVNADGTVTYTPNANAWGEDSFTYTVTDANSMTATTTVSLMVEAVNDAPETTDDSFTAEADGLLDGNVLANDSDVDGDALTISTYDQSSAQGGAVTMTADGTFTYRAPDGFSGIDSFGYSVSDGRGGLASGNAVVRVETGSPGTFSQVPEYVLSSLLAGGVTDNPLRWNMDDELGSPVSVTYSILDSVPDYYGEAAPERVGYQSFSSDQAAAVRSALDLIESFTGARFVEVTAEVGQLTFGMADLPYGAGWAYTPSKISPKGGDVWLDSQNAENQDLSIGSQGFSTLIHEIGHAMGLQHPHEGEGMPYDELNAKYSVMSYAEHPDMPGSEPLNYMLYDIYALKHLYGHDETTTSGNDLYGLSGADGLVTTIWDGGGWDVLDASASSSSVILDLRDGHYSTVGSAQGWLPASENVAIAFGTAIEEARGGAGDDILVGNGADNRLSGGGGADRFVISQGLGSTIVVDFEDGRDVIDLSGRSLTFADLDLRAALDGVSIGLDEGDIFLADMSVDRIGPSDFLFGTVA